MAATRKKNKEGVSLCPYQPFKVAWQYFDVATRYFDVAARYFEEVLFDLKNRVDKAC